MYATQRLYFACIFCMLIYWTSPIQETLVQINVTENKVMCEFGSSFSNEGSKDLKVETNLQCDLSSVPVPCGVIRNQQCRDKLMKCHLLQGECDDRNNNTHYCYLFSSNFMGNVCCVVQDIQKCKLIPKAVPAEQPTSIGLELPTVEVLNPMPSELLSVLSIVLLVVVIFILFFQVVKLCYKKLKEKKKSKSEATPIQSRQDSTSSNSTCDHELLVIKELNDLPVAMGITIQSVFINEVLYVGGGGVQFEEHKDIENDFKVMMLQNSEWTVIPEPKDENKVKYFAMTSLKNELVLIGGRAKSTNEPTDQTITYDASSKKWHVDIHPKLNKARESATATFYDNHLIVVGGCNQKERIDSVEVLNMSDETAGWKPVQSLPIPRSLMKSTVISESLYLMGGLDHVHKHPTRVVYKVNLNNLIKSSDESSDPKLWLTIRDVPYEHSTPVSVNGRLFAVGGRDSQNNAQDSIYIYQTWQKEEDIYNNERYDKRSMAEVKWVLIGHLKNQRFLCTCSVNKDGQIIVMGGDIKPEHEDIVSFIKSVESVDVSAFTKPYQV